MKLDLVASVGKGFPNMERDVIATQRILNKIYIGGGNAYGEPLPENGFFCTKTENTILGFQLLHLIGDREIDERVMRPDGHTESAINKVMDRIHPTRDKDLAHLLLLSDMTKNTTSQRVIYDRKNLRSFLMTGLAGNKVDDRYWPFVYIDKFDAECLPTRKSGIVGIKRKPEKSALEGFRAVTKGFETVEKVQQKFYEFEEIHTANVTIVHKFFESMDGVGDARAEIHAEEVGYVRDFAERARQVNPRSIYGIYRDYIDPMERKYVHGK